MELGDRCEECCAMHSGNESRGCCPGRSAIPDVRLRTTGYLLKRCCGSHGRGAHGAICRLNLARGTACTSALCAGPRRAYGTECSRSSPRTGTSKKCFSTLPRVRQKKTPDR